MDARPEADFRLRSKSTARVRPKNLVYVFKRQGSISLCEPSARCYGPENDCADCQYACIESPRVELTVKCVNVEKLHHDLGLPSRSSLRWCGKNNMMATRRAYSASSH